MLLFLPLLKHTSLVATPGFCFYYVQNAHYWLISSATSSKGLPLTDSSGPAHSPHHCALPQTPTQLNSSSLQVFVSLLRCHLLHKAFPSPLFFPPI